MNPNNKEDKYADRSNEFFDNHAFYENIDPKLEFEWMIEAKSHEKCIRQINLQLISTFFDAGKYIPTYRKCVNTHLLYLKQIMRYDDLKSDLKSVMTENNLKMKMKI